jgi:hypothetical protein
MPGPIETQSRASNPYLPENQCHADRPPNAAPTPNPLTSQSAMTSSPQSTRGAEHTQSAETPQSAQWKAGEAVLLKQYSTSRAATLHQAQAEDTQRPPANCGDARLDAALECTGSAVNIARMVADAVKEPKLEALDAAAATLEIIGCGREIQKAIEACDTP